MDQIFIESHGGTHRGLERGREDVGLGGEEMTDSSGVLTEEEEEEKEEQEEEKEDEDEEDEEEEGAWEQKLSELDSGSYMEDEAERRSDPSDPRPVSRPAEPRSEPSEEPTESDLWPRGGHTEEEGGERKGNEEGGAVVARQGGMAQGPLEVRLRPIESRRGYVRISLEEVQRYYRFSRCCHWLHSKCLISRVMFSSIFVTFLSVIPSILTPRSALLSPPLDLLTR